MNKLLFFIFTILIAGCGMLKKNLEKDYTSSLSPLASVSIFFFLNIEECMRKMNIPLDLINYQNFDFKINANKGIFRILDFNYDNKKSNYFSFINNCTEQAKNEVNKNFILNEDERNRIKHIPTIVNAIYKGNGNLINKNIQLIRDNIHENDIFLKIYIKINYDKKGNILSLQANQYE